ncbi:putative Ig domain-containing protein [Prosthecobacter vanneervenii]|uniref:Staphylococcus aureus surface protein A n=1 Tax=Prosthecobacter vanneervenii TaxID=48466 RepID=A0A7W8DKK0_9BACT|nr:putative Ig domain-containing protein [Prosthecobacter vanneervenii]MBB5033349.1 hypothetical protein [Prosthecobacter vanneervenii]
MRESASRLHHLTCRLTAARLIVFMTSVLLVAATTAGAATDFSDYSLFGSAGSTQISSIKIGASTDTESVITANATATGDDTTGNDDEDGVTLPASIVAGTSGSMTINVSNSSGATVFLNVWIDYNRNGVLTDSGEQVASNTTIATGTSAANRTVNFTVPATASIGVAGVRVRLTSTSSPGPTGTVGNGEVEDNVMTIACPTVTLSPTTVTTPTVGTSYSQTLTASGSSTTFSYAVTSGTLPAGLSLSSAGVLSGTPTSSASATFTVTATGANTCAGSQAYTITPVCPTISLSPSTIPDAFVGSSFSQTFTSSGGTGSYSYAVTSGTLPSGLSLSSAGVLSGTPTTSNGAGTNVTIQATDANGCRGSQTYTVQVCPVITISPATLPATSINAPYTQSVSGSGGATPYTYAIASGSLPSGLSLNPSTGLINGTVSSTAAATFTVSATDANGCVATRSYTLTPPTTDFGDFASFGSVSSNYNSNLKLGMVLDTESVAVTNSTATGDDITGADDEDGVTLPAYVVQGTSGSMTVNVTNNTGATAYLNAWIDYNNNGVLTDSGEQIAANTTIATGTTAANRALSFTVPATAAQATVGVRVRLTSTSSPGPTGASGNGEVEDYVVSILPATDFGDDSAFGIAGSTLSTSLRMGAQVDSESSGLGNAAATGDDTNGVDDEDGVTVPTSVVQGQTGVTVTVNLTNSTGADAYLNGWIDFNNNGVLTDVGEQIVVNDVVATGTSGASRSYTFTVPASAAPGVIGVRFRLTSSASPGNSGISGTGEVEDYAITVVPGSDRGDFSMFADASSYNTSTLSIGDLEDTEITAVTNLAATGDDITNISDEDGVTLQAILVQGQAGVAVTVKLNNTSGAPAYLNGWLDFNNNGSLTDADDQVITNVVVDDGTVGDYQTFYFDVPSNATLGSVGARFRLTSAASPGPTGASSYGEVEDYTTTIVAPSSNFRDYFYTIRSAGGRFYLDEISVYNPNSSSPTVSVTPGILDLTTASTGFNASATDAYMNGLALDWLNRRFYWLATSTGSSGYNANLYTAAYDNVSKTWSYQLVTGSSLSNIPLNTGSPVSGSASSGAFPRAAYYNGAYYAGGQLSNNVAVWNLSANGLSLNSPAITDYTSFFHTSQTFNGGDFVIRPQDGLLVTSTVINSANTLFTQFIDNGINPSGSAATSVNFDAQIPYSTNSSVQIAGVGGVSRLYALGATGTNIYRIDNYDTSSPVGVRVGPLPTASYTDLSEGISSSVTSLGVKGIVYNDINGLSDGILSGTGTNAGGTLYAMLVDGSGNLVDSFPVKSDGTFILGGATANTTYRVVLSTSYGSLGSTAPAAALPKGWLNAGEFLGSGAGSDGTVDGRLTVAVGSVGVVNATFGLSQTLSIGDTVWNDVNNNGLFDSGESGIGSVTVQLWSPGTDNAIGGTGTAADTLITTSTTDATGSYSFAGLAAGRYFVTVTPPTLYSFVSSTVAGDNGVDNDNNGSQPGGRATTVYSPVITLAQATEPGNLTAGSGDNTEDTIDFGLLTAYDYGDYSSFGSAGSALVSNLFIGSQTDAEYSAVTNTTATGDDITGVDDEDGVTVPAALVQGTSGTLSVTMTNTSGASAFLNAWVDFNGNGVLTDSGEQVASNTVIANGTNAATRNITFTVPSGATTGTAGVRVRLTSVSTPGSVGTSGNGEVEDYTVSICPSITLSPTTAAAAAVGTAYSQTISANGGTSPYTYSVSSGTLPAWATLSSGGVLSGTPTTTTSATFTVRATDARGCSGTVSYTITPVCSTVTIAQTSLPQGTMGVAYSTTLTAGGGLAPYGSWSITSGTLPSGLSLATGTGVISGTPTATASPATTLTVRVVDANGCPGTQNVTLQICPVVTLTPATLSAATVGTAYSQTITASGGTAPYSYTVSSGTLPTWATLTSAGALSGTPNSTTSATFTVRATDANGCAGTLSYTLAPICPTITIGQSTLPQGIVGTAYSTTLTATGGTSPYSSWTITSGTLPAGLTLAASTGIISGTPTASASPSTTLTVRVNDTYGCQGSKSITLQICPVLTISPTTLSTPTVGTSYSQTLTTSGGASPYTYTVTSGALPTWATLSSSGVLSGTPNSTTSATFTVKATDANNCSSTLSYTVIPVCPTITIGQSSLPQGTVGTAYSTTLSATGGTAPYSSWTITSGNLPAGLTLNASTGVISGTPTASASPSTTITVRVNDTYGCQGSKSITLQICPVITLSPATPAAGMVGSAYSQSFSANGGSSAYTYAVASGTLPAGLTLNSSTGVVSGTPTTQVSSNVTLRVTDANGCVGTLAVTFAISCPVITLTPATLSPGIVGTAYSQTVSASGGSSSYTYAVSSGTLPSGLSLNASTGIISGTPTLSNGAGSTFTISATDSFNCAGTKSYTVQVCPAMSLLPATLPVATVGTAFSQTITTSSGASPFTYTIPSGTLPPWATLSSAGVLSGTPTSTASYTFTIKSTDTYGCSTTRTYILAPACPNVTIAPTSLNGGIVGSAYSATLSATPSATYSWTVASGALPAGLSLNSSTGVVSGSPTTGGTASFTVSASTGPVAVPQLKFSTYNLDLNPGDSFNIRDYVLPSDGSSSPIDWSKVSFTYTSAGANDPTTPADWNLTSFNAGQLVTVTSADAAAGGNSGTGRFRIYIVRAGQSTYDDHMEIRVDPTVTSLVNSAKVSPPIPMACSGTRAYTVKICPVITMTPSTLPNGTINSAYSQTISASGGATPYVYAVSSGTLPAGLTLNTSTGVLSGTPTSVTSTTFVISATDANGCAVTQSYTVAPAPDTDYGDYSVFGSVGSRMNSTLRLGATTDAEATATTNTSATGDDITGIDDEDGVVIASSITQGAAASMTVTMTNTSGASAYLNVWIDFNGNGLLTDSGEQIATNILVATGTTNSPRIVSFFTPVNATLGTVGVRTRLTSTSSPGATGISGNGEVEDFVTTITAPTTDFGDFSLFADASSTGSTNLRIGALVDLEGTSTLNAAATGDDITNQDDEDGVTFPSMTAGQPITLPVTVTNNTGAVAYLNAWIDFNNNGALTDAGEQIATNVSVATGLTNSTVNVSFTVPTNAVTAAATIGTRFRLTSVSSPGSIGAAGTGEVEDHGVTILAPLTDFGDFSGAPTVSNTASTNLRLGALVDTEYAATTDATATGDDITGVDDEDGVTLPAMTAGAPATIPVTATNATGSPAYLNVWIDYNNNGVFTDAGEQIATNTGVPTGTNNATFNISITVPAAAVTGTNLGVRARISTDISPGSTGAGGVGEVEDYVVNIAQPTTDFGDYSLFTLASSTASSALRLGALTDTEYNATTNTTATGDDITGVDDEDGVTLPSMIAGGPAVIPVVVTNTSGTTAYFNAWIDFNGNGVLTDPGEQIVTNVTVATGTSNSTQNLSITVPATTLTGVNIGVRTMLTSSASPSSTGYVGTGEIEDYVVNITAPTTDFGDFSGFADASQGISPSLQMGASVDAEYASTRNATATGDDTTGIDDEDGVTLPSMTAGQTVTIPVVITNSTGALGYLNAWIDYNNNGVLTDAGEQIATNINIPTGSSGTTFNITLTVPTTAVTGTNVGARFRLSAPTSPGSTGANAAVGEIEDYVINIAAPTLDYSDFNGFGNASSTASTALRMGALVDAEYNPTVNAAATGDDITGSDDEDGVTMPSLSAGVAATIPVVVTNTSGASAFLNAWIDYNNNGVLTDSGEQIATNIIIATGTSAATRNIAITVPNTATTGTNLGVRFRLTSVSSPGPTGTSGTGEVEDYLVNIVGPTIDYGDWSGAADASNTIVSSLKLGSLIDAEFSSTKNATATGDDITYLADEDGVALPAMTAGGSYSIPVIVTNTSGATAYLNAWIDYNNNGVFTDTGEQILTNVSVANGSSGTTLNQNITVPATATTGTSLGVRFRLTSAISPGSTGTGGGNGEVEDYVTTIAVPTTDFGDLTKFGSASSTMNSNLRLGLLEDTEFTATTNTTATGDDITNQADEDGVTLPVMTAGAPATIPVVVTNNTGSAAYLNAWIDYNNNGVLTDSGEQIATNVSIPTGSSGITQNLSITIPANALTGTSLGVRVRLTSVTSPGSTGASGSGEVEDYVTTIAAPLLDYGDLSTMADAASTSLSGLRLGALIDTEYVSTKNATATGDDITNLADEDGVVLPSMIAGAPATIPVTVTNTTGSTAYLNVWIDYNNNASFADSSEQIATNVSIPTGSSNATQNLSITVPANAITGSNVGVRVRLTDVLTPGATGNIGNGEVEDYVTVIAVPTTDFGDWNGALDASSIASSNLRMGALADTEYVSTRNSTATGDDITNLADEDGVTLGSQTPGTAGNATVVVTNNSGATGYLNAWIDYNNNGSFTDSGEQIATNIAIATGTNGAVQTVNFIVPITAIPGQRGARFRLTSTQNPTPVGASGIGEVEDYMAAITCLPIALSPTTLTTPTVGTAYSQSVTASGSQGTPYTYSIGSGSLPAGLTMSSTGVISGTPTSSAAATFTVVAADIYSCTGTASYTLTPACPAIVVSPTTLPSGSINTAYSQTISASGGNGTYTYSVSSGTLPAGLSLNSSTGVVSGTPTSSNGAGVSVTFKATDIYGCFGTRTATFIICPVVTLTPATLPAPVVGTAYSQTLAGSGGATPYTFSLASGTLPTWATLSSSGVLSGTPTSTTAATFSVKATDANGCSGTLSYTITPVCPTISITQSTLPQGTIGTAYSTTLSATGGTAPYGSWTITSGTLPAGLNLSAAGVISGTPTATASPATTITVRTTDTYGCQGSKSITLQICPIVTLAPTTLTTPVVGTAYSQTITASGGTAPYTYTLASGSLPAWASLSSAGVITGTPTSTTAATFSVKATDANGCAGTLSYTLTPNCPAISITPVTSAQGIVGTAYSQTLTASGGTAPYSSWTVTSGTLPAGLSLSTGGVISGTPTTSNGAGVSVTLRVTDNYGCQGTQVILIQVCPVITVSPATLATATVSTAYSQTITATGGASPYTYTVSSGTLPTWATLSSSGVLSGTPDSPNSATFTVKATDANGCFGTQSYTLTPVCPTLTISPTTATTGTVGTAYSQTLSGSGGTGPYASWTVTSGSLPAGLSLNASTGVISGTPTASTGAATSFVVRTTDARGCQVTATISLKICPVVTLAPTTLATATAGASYSQTISASGGVSPYVYAVASGTLPAGLTFNTSTGVLSGTPTAVASATFTISATDANGCPGTRSYTLTPACQTITVTPATLPAATVNTAYSQTVSSSGGLGTVTYSISSGALPAGLSLNSTTGVISGTPTSTAAATFTVRATDGNACTGTLSYTVTPACPVITVTPATLTTGGVGVAYSQTMTASGGIAPYGSWTVTSGTLPAGLTLNASTGVISGTPTTSNGTGVNVTIRATDANGCQGSAVASIKICPVITQSPATLTAPVVGTAYSQTISGSGGVSPYTFTITSGTLPAGLTLSSSGVLSGTATSTTTATFTVKATASDGCSGTANYTVTPVCPALSLTPSGALPLAYLGTSYTQTLTASGGTAPYTYTLQSGDLPSGVLLSSTGIISGTPAAKGTFPVNVKATDTYGCSQTFSLSIQVLTLSIGNLVFEDSNNNGLKDSGEPGVAGATVQLFTTGDDNAIGGTGTAADTQVGSSLTTDSTGAYLFNSLPSGNYYVKVTPPADYLYTGGTPDTADDNVDNNNDGAQPGGAGTPVFSPVVNLSGGAESITDGDTDPNTNLTVDFGLWSSVTVGNFVFLDINGDGRRNEGESLGNIYVELYAQGATPGVDTPVSVGSSGCSCKGRYYLDGLNPGTYFLHIPASQFSTGMPLEGLLPMSSVVAGDDDVGQDLIFNNSPATNGASTAAFTLRPGFCPVGTAESGAEGSTDDAIDARVDLTRDLGIVAPAGTGFAASEVIRRYIVTGGFVASVLPGASTFATWSQDSAIGGPADDPDEDGLPNLLEYALGTDPASPLQPNRFALTHDSTGSLTALLTVPSATHDDLIISLETLTDLTQSGKASAWKKLSMASTTTINADGTLTRAYGTLEKLLVFKGLDAGYLHLRVDLDANRDGVPEATVTSAIQGWGRQSFATGSRTFSMPLLNAAFFTGRAVSVSGSEVMLPAIITLPAGSLYLEALDGPLAGQRFEIDATASSGNTVVLLGGQDLSGLTGAHICIRLHHTLSVLLPPASFSSEDRVLFFDPAAGNYTTCTNTSGSWISDILSMNARPFAAHEAAMVQIRGAGNVLMFTGEVRQTSLATALVAGTQLIAPGWPVVTQAPVSGLTSGTTPDNADRLRIWDGDTTPSATDYTGYYLDGTTNPPAWKPQTAPAPDANLFPFHGYFLIRTAPGLLKQAQPW